MPNNRIFYAIQAVKVKPCQLTTGSAYNYGAERVLKGIQSVGITTTFNLDPVYQLGQLDLYDQVEEVPDIEVTMTKVLDGRQTIYNACIDGSGAAGSSNGIGLTQISDRRADFALGIWSDTSINTPVQVTGVSGVITTAGVQQYLLCSGMYVSQVSYNLTSDGNFTEDVTLVGNSAKWGGASAGGITGFSSGIQSGELRTVHRRWSLDLEKSTLPTGTGGGIGGGAPLTDIHINSVTLSCSLGREAINQLASRAPYYRYINFPVEVTSEFEVTAVSGSQVNGDDFTTLSGCTASAAKNLETKTIKIKLCDINGTNTGYLFDLGDKNKLTSSNYTGGDTGGGNATVSYSYQTYNAFSVSGSTV